MQQSLSSSANNPQYIPFATRASYPVRAGNWLRPLIDSDATFTRICEAVNAASHSVWVTVAFLAGDFEMPGGYGSLFDVLDRAATRNIDVRVIFWRNNEGSGFADHTMFSGSTAHREFLRQRGSRFFARWDRAQKRYCQHQKSWLIDAGHEGEIAFVGGINLHGVPAPPGHAHDGESTHDVYVELRGPSATDVHHNFVQRWNEASERLLADGVWPDTGHHNDLAFPSRASAIVGDATVQVQRSIRAGHYTDTTPSPGGGAFAIQDGETSIYEQYLLAIDAARSTIYIEDQSIGSPEIVQKLDLACARGVEVIYLVPADAAAEMRVARKLPQNKSFFDSLAALGRHRNFTLAGIAAPGTNGLLRNVYVHAKIALVDDGWSTIGSCNIAARSFFGDSELNVSFWAPVTVRGLRRELFMEHIGVDTGAMTDRSALELYREIAFANAGRRHEANAMEGLAFSLDPRSYPPDL